MSPCRRDQILRFPTRKWRCFSTGVFGTDARVAMSLQQETRLIGVKNSREIAVVTDALRALSGKKDGGC
jgi:hypothetical protein